ISFAVSEPKDEVRPSGYWTSAWNKAVQAISFAFPYQAHELRDYAEYILLR
ncbi:hypothetical protein B0H34DRAFT_645551, partial [Crassisporium funariophilum]